MEKSSLYFLILFGIIVIISSCESSNNTSSSSDIGCVVYVKNPDASGNLIANWAYTPNDTASVVGSGYTVKSPGHQSFEGAYEIIYTGAGTDTFDLVITKERSSNDSLYYKVLWKDLETKEVLYHGTGVEKGSQLIVGWRQ